MEKTNITLGFENRSAEIKRAGKIENLILTPRIRIAKYESKDGNAIYGIPYSNSIVGIYARRKKSTYTEFPLLAVSDFMKYQNIYGLNEKIVKFAKFVEDLGNNFQTEYNYREHNKKVGDDLSFLFLLESFKYLTAILPYLKKHQEYGYKLDYIFYEGKPEINELIKKKKEMKKMYHKIINEIEESIKELKNIIINKNVNEEVKNITEAYNKFLEESLIKSGILEEFLKKIVKEENLKKEVLKEEIKKLLRRPYGGGPVFNNDEYLYLNNLGNIIYKTLKENPKEKIHRLKYKITKEIPTISYVNSKIIYLNKINDFYKYIEKLPDNNKIKNDLLNKYINLLTDNYHNIEKASPKDLESIKKEVELAIKNIENYLGNEDFSFSPDMENFLKENYKINTTPLIEKLNELNEEEIIEQNKRLLIQFNKNIKNPDIKEFIKINKKHLIKLNTKKLENIIKELENAETVFLTNNDIYVISNKLNENQKTEVFKKLKEYTPFHSVYPLEEANKKKAKNDKILKELKRILPDANIKFIGNMLSNEDFDILKIIEKKEILEKEFEENYDLGIS